MGEEARSYSEHKVEVRAGAVTETIAHRNADSAELDVLCALLESQNLAALDKFNLISLSLSEIVGALRFERLRIAIENLDFHQGVQLLHEARLLGPPSPAQMPPLAAGRG